MTPVREAVTLPALFLTVLLAGSVEPGTPLRFAPPSPFALLLGVMMIAALIEAGALRPNALLSSRKSALANLNGLVVTIALFGASAQAANVVMPASGAPAVLMGILLFAMLAQALAIGANRTRMLRGLMVTLAIAFILKFIMLNALSAPAHGLARIVQALFDSVTLGAISQPPLHPAAAYVAFATLMLYLIGLILLPARRNHEPPIVPGARRGRHAAVADGAAGAARLELRSVD